MKGLHVKGVSKTYSGNGNETHALENISLKLEGNGITAILGPSGCGKTTLLKLIAGLSRPTKGKIFLEGREINGASNEIGLIFQEPALFPWLNVEENILFGPKINSLEADSRALISSVGLEGFERHYPFMLSLGMQRRASIARAFAVKPRILLMDEPFTSLDAITREKMHQLLLGMQLETRLPVIFVTHDIEEALLLAEKIIVMTGRPGKIKALINNPLPRPKGTEIKYTQEFLAMRKQLKGMLEEKTE